MSDRDYGFKDWALSESDGTPSGADDLKLREIEEGLKKKLKGGEPRADGSAGEKRAASRSAEAHEAAAEIFEGGEKAFDSGEAGIDERLRGKREKVTGKKKGRKVIAASLLGAVVFAVAVFALTSGQFGRPKEPTPEEKKYWGRYLPKGYSEPKLTEGINYGEISRIRMARIDASAMENSVSIAVGDAIKNRIVYFEYRKPGADPVSLLAYVKPSGRLFVGASYCPPCQSRYQRIEGDSTLTCEVCGTKRDLEGMIGINGACKLYPIDEFPAKVVGDRIYVDKEAIDRYSPQPIDRPVGTL